MIDSSSPAQALPTFLLAKMIEKGFETAHSHEDFAGSVSYRWLAETAAQHLSQQNVLTGLEKEIQSLLSLQEVSP